MVEGDEGDAVGKDDGLGLAPYNCGEAVTRNFQPVVPGIAYDAAEGVLKAVEGGEGLVDQRREDFDRLSIRPGEDGLVTCRLSQLHDLDEGGQLRSEAVAQVGASGSVHLGVSVCHAVEARYLLHTVRRLVVVRA